MFSDAPPSRDEVTTSRTWPDSVEVKTLTSSGMIAPASVPQVMIVDSFHHSECRRRASGISRYDDDVGQRHRDDRGQPHQPGQRRLEVHLRRVAVAAPSAIASLIRYETPLAMTIMMRITKIQTSSCTCTVGSATASRMNEISATPVTP